MQWLMHGSHVLKKIGVYRSELIKDCKGLSNHRISPLAKSHIDEASGISLSDSVFSEDCSQRRSHQCPAMHGYPRLSKVVVCQKGAPIRIWGCVHCSERACKPCALSASRGSRKSRCCFTLIIVAQCVVTPQYVSQSSAVSSSYTSRVSRAAVSSTVAIPQRIKFQDCPSAVRHASRPRCR